MIVENKTASIEKANEISSKIIALMTEETKDFGCADDPAEQIYLGCHIVGSLLAKICISLDGYGRTYAIPDFTVESIHKWINLIADEHIKLNYKKEEIDEMEQRET